MANFYLIKFFLNMKILNYFFFIFILLNTNQLKANEIDNQLEKLFEELKVNNSDITYNIEQKIWKLWSQHPTNQNLTKKLEKGSEFVRNQKFSKAIEIFSEVIELDPEWAEGWNKRATVLYMIGDYRGSQNDIDKVLNLENRHFGALAGQGLVNIQLKNYEKAIESYKKAQEIYPAMQSPKIMIKKIQDLINQQLI